MAIVKCEHPNYSIGTHDVRLFSDYIYERNRDEAFADRCSRIVSNVSYALFEEFFSKSIYFRRLLEFDLNNCLMVIVQVDDEAQPRYEECNTFVLGTYNPDNRTITFYQKNIEATAANSTQNGFNVYSLIIAVAVHELMHALFQPIDMDKIHNPYLEEPLCEAGALAFIKKYIKDKAVYTAMKSWVDSKSSYKALAHYGFGAYLHNAVPGFKLHKQLLSIILRCAWSDYDTYHKFCKLLDEKWQFHELLENCSTAKQYPLLLNYMSCFKPQPKSQDEMLKAFLELIKYLKVGTFY